MRRHTWSALIIVAVILTVTVAGDPAVAHHNFVGRECHGDQGELEIGPQFREDSLNYAEVADKEGYHWGGGCWSDNQRDDQPGDPVKTESTHGEGGDCSGFTFKSWMLGSTYSGDIGFYYWGAYEYVHGPYTAASYKGATANTSNQFSGWSRTDVWMADAMASSDHVGEVYTPNTSSGTDLFIEAKSERDGTDKNAQRYRETSGYEGVRRNGWKDDEIIREIMRLITVGL